MQLILLLFVGLCHRVDGRTKAGKEAALVDNLVKDFWEWRLAESPEYGTKYGWNGHDARLEEYTEEAFSRQLSKAKSMLSQVNAIRDQHLPSQQKFSKQILQHNLETFINGYPYRRFSIYNFYSSITSSNPIAYWKTLISQMKFKNSNDYEKLLSRYRLLPFQIEQMMNLMGKAVELGTQQNALSFSGALETIDKQLVGDINETLFYAPFREIPHTMDDDLRSRVLLEGIRLINDTVRPAIRELRTFVAETLIPNARPGLGVGSLDGGNEFYQQCIEWHTTTKLSAQQIFDLGLAEIERISNKMQEIMVKDGFYGSIHGYVDHLRSEADNAYASGEAMLEGYRDIVNASHAMIGQILHRVPGIKVEVRPNWNPRATGGFYADPPLDGSRPGIFYASIANANTKLKMGMTSTSWHEAEPGHHTQMSFAIEEDIPNFRRAIEFRKYTAVPFNWPFMTAYIEGWGLYAEALGEEYGAYTDSKMLFGRYSQEMLRAVRLVIDPGVHVFGWTFDHALEFMANYTTLPDMSMRNEIKRYISWPGQATAYKVGELKIWELRRRAEKALGSKFDRRDFHTRVLELGPAPLSILEEQIENWITENQENSAVHSTVNTKLLLLLGIVLCFSIAQ